MNDVTNWNHFQNFSAWEFNCRCCSANYTAHDLVSNLQALRNLVNRPIIINSGTRCLLHNAAVQGAPASYHVATNRRPSLAADIVIPGLTIREMLKAAESIQAFDRSGIGIYPNRGFIHVDIGHPRSCRWGQLKRRQWLSVLECIADAAKVIVPALL